MIEFKTNPNSTRINSCEIDKLIGFIFSNKKYIKITINILARVRYNINDKNELNSTIDNDPISELVIKDEHIDEYKSVMYDFYNCDDDVLNKRRGRLLEKIMDRIGVINNIIEFDKIEEALVYKNGVLISKKDIDTVYNGNKIELQECKATLTNNCRPPFYKNNSDRKKFELMNSIRDHVDNGIEVFPYLVTYSTSTKKCLRFLARYNINNLMIISGNDIEELCNRSFG
ncbi:hypothetical protein J2Z53_000495 [Clostridium moniliforme]|uniref:Restriction endonuclease n=1 Tax=Clostridium moniliforme TaxID=39489 RepID=A0ABS4EY46_9CLOT|nr:hypothetical protein [Clostridium moniliforme]MBP1888916.1 hypothetical protein [Clostridium moniliforme]